MARERGAVTGIVGGIVHRFDVRETGEIHKACAQDRRADGGGQTLSQGRSGAGCSVAGAADDRHGVSLWSVSGESRAHAKTCTTRRAGFQTAPALRGFVVSVIVLITLCCGPVSGLTRGKGLGLNLKTPPSHAAVAQWI